MYELGVVYFHHDLSAVAAQNLTSFKMNNPDVPVVAVSASYTFPGGYYLPKLGRPGAYWLGLTEGGKKSKAWANSDVPIYVYYLSKREQCRRWLLVEWDVYCSISLRIYLDPIWDEDLASVNVYLHERDTWYWFDQKSLLPEDLRKNACGVSPLGVLFCSDRCLRDISELVMQRQDLKVFSELRFGTLARSSGYTPIEIPGAKETIKWAGQWSEKEVLSRKALWHPVKFLVGSRQS